MGLAPVAKTYQPVWPVEFTEAVALHYLEDSDAADAFKRHVIESLMHELDKADITARRSDVDLLITDHSRLQPWLGAEVRARWSGCKDAEGKRRVDFRGGPLDGRTHASDEPPNAIRHRATITGHVLYRPQGIDPADGHWIYQYEGGAGL
jgi:hypothetical protein